MRIRILLFTSMRIRIHFSLWCGSGSSFPLWCWIRIQLSENGANPLGSRSATPQWTITEITTVAQTLTDLTPGAVEAHGGISELGPELRLEVFVAEVAFALQSEKKHEDTNSMVPNFSLYGLTGFDQYWTRIQIWIRGCSVLRKDSNMRLTSQIRKQAKKINITGAQAIIWKTSSTSTARLLQLSNGS